MNESRNTERDRNGELPWTILGLCHSYPTLTIFSIASHALHQPADPYIFTQCCPTTAAQVYHVLPVTVVDQPTDRKVADSMPERSNASVGRHGPMQTLFR